MQPTPKIVSRTWDEVASATRVAAARILQSGRTVNGVYGIPRGGTCLAVLFSHLLNVEFLSEPKTGCLIVDDICDTGDTLAKYLEYCPVFYTDVAKSGAKIQPELCGLSISETDRNAYAWFEFPWELALPPTK